MIDGGLSKEFQKNIRAHWQRIETGGTGLGIPDLNYCVIGKEGWIELKHTTSWKVRVRPDQCAWAERRARAGGRIFMAVRQQGAGRDDLWMLSSDAPRLLLKGMRLDLLPGSLVFYHGVGRPWDWDRIQEIMTK